MHRSTLLAAIAALSTIATGAIAHEGFEHPAVVTSRISAPAADQAVYMHPAASAMYWDDAATAHKLSEHPAVVVHRRDAAAQVDPAAAVYLHPASTAMFSGSESPSTTAAATAPAASTHALRSAHRHHVALHHGTTAAVIRN